MVTPFEKDYSSRGEETRILIVEDSPGQQDIFREYLSSLGYSCTCAFTCEEGRKAVRKTRFACSLIDLGLPDGRGMDLLGEFYKADPHMVPLILTGDGSPETIIDTMRSGAFDYLIKPVNLVSLRAGVARALTHHEALQDRANLVDLLREERDQLKTRIEAATADIRAYAESCEASNALLHALLRLTRLSTEFQSEEGLLRNLFDEIVEHLPLECVALCDTSQREFLAALKDDDGVAIIASHGEVPENGMDAVLASADPESLVGSWVMRHTGLDSHDYKVFAFPQSFWDRPVCTVGFYLAATATLNETEREFLGMCAHFIASEWQRSRLLLHTAQHANLGNIAIELSKGFLQSLTAVRTATDIVNETVSSPEALEGLAIIGENVDYLTRQAQTFHSLSHMREDSIETVRLDHYIDQTLDLLSKAIENRGVSIEKDFQVDSECVLLNGTALARTFLDLISSAVRTVEPGGRILLSLRQVEPDHVLCKITHGVASSELFGLPGMANKQSMLELIKSHPSFMLAQRAVHSCGGKLTLEREGDSHSTFCITVPRNALSSSLVQEPIR